MVKYQPFLLPGRVSGAVDRQRCGEESLGGGEHGAILETVGGPVQLPQPHFVVCESNRLHLQGKCAHAAVKRDRY